jgi:hypothetical protein
MRGAYLFLPLALLACSKDEDPPVTTTDAADAAEACVPFDAGPKMEVAPPPDTLGGGDEDATVEDTAPPDVGPIVTRAEVDDIIKLSCAFSSCHGTKPGQGKLFLPAPGSGNWVVEVVNVASTTHKTMKRVVPGDPSNSFLIHKMTNGLCALSKDCVNNNCGDRMPQANDPVSPDDLKKFIEWVRQGATEK